MNTSKDSFVVNNILRHVKEPRSQGPLYSALLSCLLPTFYDYNAEGKNMTKNKQTYIPPMFFLCLSVCNIFSTPYIFLCLSACNIFSTSYVFLPPKSFSVCLSVTFFLYMSVTCVYLICFHSLSQFIYRYL